MFTGIIEAVGKITDISSSMHDERTQRRVQIRTPFIDVKPGESIAVNGVCLTATELLPGREGQEIDFFISPETCERSNLSRLLAGHTVNLERALRFNDRLSGHLVQGHVDGQAELIAVNPIQDAWELTVKLPDDLLKYVIEKGSIALDGISLTVNSVKNQEIRLVIIPHTVKHTTLSTVLSRKSTTHHFNVEVDMIAKYVAQYAFHTRSH